MKNCWITYSEQWQPGPMSYWVHVETDKRPWGRSAKLDPPLPGPVAGKGFARFYVEFNGCTFEFASLDELRACIDTLSRKLLPTTIRLSRERRGYVGPNSHWLSRLPKKTKPWRYREPAVQFMEESLAFFQSEVT